MNGYYSSNLLIFCCGIADGKVSFYYIGNLDCPEVKEFENFRYCPSLDAEEYQNICYEYKGNKKQ